MRLRIVVLTDYDEEPPRVFSVPLPESVLPGEEVGRAVEKAVAAFRRTLTNVIEWEKQGGEARRRRRDSDFRCERDPFTSRTSN